VLKEAVKMHQTVLLREAIDALQINPSGVYVDCTFGRGGHARLILSQLGPQGRLIAFDKDLAAIEAAQAIQDERFHILHSGFVDFKACLEGLGYQQVEGVLMDLGVSSPQLDEAARGFSFRFDAPLDMRMDASRGITAAQWLNQATQQEIADVIKDYGEERFAKQIAASIVESRAMAPITTTRQLANLVAKVVWRREPGQDPATRTFQAIRIFINRELEELSLALPQIMATLRPEVGRLAVIAFHSLEDRIVKRFMMDAAQGDQFPTRLPVKVADIAMPPLSIVGKPIRASIEEIKHNPRARSAILRIAQRTTGALR
jgi:16S rRNA (cytosine1402-N4)-methyltransferase